MSFHKPHYSPRLHGAIRTLEDRIGAARAEKYKVEVVDSAADSPHAAAIRGKIRGYSEALDLLRAIEDGHNLPRRLRWTDRRRKNA
jgi:hypothetical protein